MNRCIAAASFVLPVTLPAAADRRAAALTARGVHRNAKLVVLR